MSKLTATSTDFNPEVTLPGPTAEFLTRPEAVLWLNQKGIPLSIHYLKNNPKNGPKQSRFGKRVLIRIRDLEAWLEERCK